MENTEAVLTEIVHNLVKIDEEQGGLTEGTGAVIRVLILWTVIIYRLLVSEEGTCAVFVDLANFFDTISSALIANFMAVLQIPMGMAEYVGNMYEYSTITVRTKRGTAEETVHRGFKQGGRFSTTAAKLCLMELKRF